MSMANSHEEGLDERQPLPPTMMESVPWEQWSKMIATIVQETLHKAGLIKSKEGKISSKGGEGKDAFLNVAPI